MIRTFNIFVKALLSDHR